MKLAYALLISSVVGFTGQAQACKYMDWEYLKPERPVAAPVPPNPSPSVLKGSFDSD